MVLKSKITKDLKDKFKLKDIRPEKFFDTTFFQAELDKDGTITVSTIRNGKGVKVKLSRIDLQEALHNMEATKVNENS